MIGRPISTLPSSSVFCKRPLRIYLVSSNQLLEAIATALHTLLGYLDDREDQWAAFASLDGAPIPVLLVGGAACRVR